MNVYITYDRYEHDEWYSIYNIETNKQKAIKHFKEVDLVDFLSSGPDDCHSFQLQKVIMSKRQYLKLLHLFEEGTEHNITKFMIPIFDETEYEVETIFFTDGCSDNISIVEYYCDCLGVDKDDEDEKDAVCERIQEDDNLYNKYLKEYIKFNY